MLVRTFIGTPLLELDISESDEGNRRVLAVLTDLREVHDWT